MSVLIHVVWYENYCIYCTALTKLWTCIAYCIGFFTVPLVKESGVLKWACLFVCLCVYLSACISLEPHLKSSVLDQIFCACYLWFWLGPPFCCVAILYVLLWMMPRLYIMATGQEYTHSDWLAGTTVMWHYTAFSNWPTIGQHQTGVESDFTFAL